MEDTWAEAEAEAETKQLSIYKAARSIKRKDNNLYNALRSIYSDSIFVGEIFQLWPTLPLLANLRCGLWYSPSFHSTCYFKSTDGHQNNWSFTTSRLNLHVALLSGQKGGCMIVDSTRKGKRFPDSMSKTIPIWACVLNCAILNYRNRVGDCGPILQENWSTSGSGKSTGLECDDWDCSLHLPLWVPEIEKAAIEERLDGWTKQLEASGADIASLALCLKKPLRPLWISQKTVIWLNEVPDHDSWDFTPIILISASSSSGTCQQKSTSEFSWTYIAGAGDDEESWARGLSPGLFWDHAHNLISSGPDLCNQKVADIVEKDRVYHAQRGVNAPQISVKHSKKPISVDGDDVHQVYVDMNNHDRQLLSSSGDSAVFWLGSTNVAVGSVELASRVSDSECILNCDQESMSIGLADSKAYLHLPMVSSKFDRFSILNNLPAAVKFVKVKLTQGHRVLVCCRTGDDISVCVCLAILTLLFDNEGNFDDGKSFSCTNITKWEMRRRLVFICKFATTARPSRGNLKQVFAFLTRTRVASA